MKNNFISILAVSAAVLICSTVSLAQGIKCKEDGTITRVSKAVSGAFELVTFDVKIKKPDFTVRNAKPPFQQYGSERRLKVRGDHFKSIVFRGINWECTIGESFAAATSNIKAVRSIEQFEGQVEYIIGYTKKGSYVSQTITRTASGSRVTLKFKK